MSQPRTRATLKVLAAVAVIAVIGALLWSELRPSGLGEGFASGNGRIEATEIDVATKSPGRVLEILADEGDFVQPDQVLARMDTDVLQAQLNQARAQVRRGGLEVLHGVRELPVRMRRVLLVVVTLVSSTENHGLKTKCCH